MADETKFLDGFSDDEIAEIIPSLAPSTVDRLFNARPSVFEAHLRRKLKMLRAAKENLDAQRQREMAMYAADTAAAIEEKVNGRAHRRRTA